MSQPVTTAPSNTNSTTPSTPRYLGGGGFTRFWDACSDTPFLRSETVGQVISYDDPQSMEMKAIFAAKVGLRGVNIFQVGGDSLGWDLAQAVRRGLSE